MLELKLKYKQKWKSQNNWISLKIKIFINYNHLKLVEVGGQDCNDKMFLFWFIGIL